MKTLIGCRETQTPKKAGNLRERLTSNFIGIVISQCIEKGTVLLINIYLARTLGVANFGVFCFAQIVTLHLWLAVDLGSHMYGIREIAKDKPHVETLVNPLLTMRISSGIILFVLYSAGLCFLEISVEKKYALIGCSLYLVTFAFQTNWVMKGLEKFMYIPLGTSVSALTYFIGIVIFVKDTGDLTKATVIWSLSYIPGCMLLILLLHKKVGVSYRPSFNLHLWRYHLRESVFFLLSGALMLVYRSTPILLLMYFSNEYAVGLFAAPYRVVIMLCGAGFMLPSAFYPVLSEQYKKDRSRFIEVHKNLQKYMVLLGIPVALLGTVFARPIVNLCFGV